VTRKHCEVIEGYRGFTKSEFERTLQFCREVRHVTPAELETREWGDAVVVSTDRMTVHAVNEAKIRQFALRHGLPVVAWRLPSCKRFERVFAQFGEVFYDNVKDLTVYFVVGAPAALTANLRPEKGLANGTPCVLHSLVFGTADETAAFEERVAMAAPGELVFLAEPPKFVVVRISKPELVSAVGLENDEGAIFIPIEQRPRNVNIARYMKMARGKSAQRNVEVEAHPFKLMFATTYHGVQCQTLDQILLCVDKSCPSLTYNAWYVGISRVRTGDGIRVLSLRGESEALWRARLMCLTPRATMMAFISGRPVQDCFADLEKWYAENGMIFKKRGQTTLVTGPLAPCRKAPPKMPQPKAAPGTKAPHAPPAKKMPQQPSPAKAPAKAPSKAVPCVAPVPAPPAPKPQAKRRPLQGAVAAPSKDAKPKYFCEDCNIACGNLPNFRAHTNARHPKDAPLRIFGQLDSALEILKEQDPALTVQSPILALRRAFMKLMPKFHPDHFPANKVLATRVCAKVNHFMDSLSGKRSAKKDSSDSDSDWDLRAGIAAPASSRAPAKQTKRTTEEAASAPEKKKR